MQSGKVRISQRNRVNVVIQIQDSGNMNVRTCPLQSTLHPTDTRSNRNSAVLPSATLPNARQLGTAAIPRIHKNGLTRNPHHVQRPSNSGCTHRRQSSQVRVAFDIHKWIRQQVNARKVQRLKLKQCEKLRKREVPPNMQLVSDDSRQLGMVNIRDEFPSVLRE